MYKIGIDLAVRTCGVAVFEESTLLKHVSYISKEKDYYKLQIEMTNWVINEINPYITNHEDIPHNLNIEDIFVGLNPLSCLDAARVQGSIIYEYWRITRKYPNIIGAITVRKFLGLETWLSKAEYQQWVVEKFNLGTISEEVKSEIVRTGNHCDLEYQRLNAAKKGASKAHIINLNKQLKDLNRVTKNTFNRLSKEIVKQTGVDEHQADAVIMCLGG